MKKVQLNGEEEEEEEGEGVRNRRITENCIPARARRGEKLRFT